MTTTEFRARKSSGKKLALLTSYDAPTARALEAAEIDAILMF